MKTPGRGLSVVSHVLIAVALVLWTAQVVHMATDGFRFDGRDILVLMLLLVISSTTVNTVNHDRLAAKFEDLRAGVGRAVDSRPIESLPQDNVLAFELGRQAGRNGK